MALRYQQNGYRDRLIYSTNKITPTLPASTVEGRDAEGLALPGWFESYCVPGSSVRTILPNGYSTCPMYYRGVTETVMEAAMRELMEPAPSVTPETLVTKILPAPDEYVPERIEIDLGFTKYGPNPDIADPTPIYCMRSWPPGVMYFQAQVCRPNPAAIAETEARFPNMEKLLLEMTESDGSKVDVVVDDGEIVAVEKKPNWLPLALAAGAAYFFLM